MYKIGYIVNYLVSGNAVSWYFLPENGQWSCGMPPKTFLLKHFGSVVGGSFMTGFFALPDYFLDLFKPSIDSPKSGVHYRCFNTCCNPCVKLFDLVRSDAMAYINIAGNPYCNSARYCQYMGDHSEVLEDSQCTSLSYRICAHLLIAGVDSIICLYIKGSILPTCILLIMGLSVIISTFFISIHADAGEAIAISFMSNEECEKRRESYREASKRAETFDDMEIKRGEIRAAIKQVLIDYPPREAPEEELQ
jgi:hypothetical protein